MLKTSTTVVTVVDMDAESAKQVVEAVPLPLGRRHTSNRISTYRHWIITSIQAALQLKGIGLLAVGRLSIVIATVVSVRLMTTVLSPMEVGRYSILSTFAMWFSLTFVSPAGNYMYRNFVGWVEAGALWQQYSRYLGLLCLISCFAAVMSILAHKTGLLGVPITTYGLALCMAGILLALTINSVLLTSLNLLGQRGLYVVYTSGTSWLGLGISAALILGIRHDAKLWIAGQVSGWALLSIAGYLSLRRIIAQTPRRTSVAPPQPQQQGLWTFAWPLVISTSLYWFQVQGYRIELEHLISASSVGLLTTGLLLGANPVTITDTLLGEYLRPQYYKAIASNDRAKQETAWSSMSGVFVAVLIPVAVLVGFSGPFLTAILVGPSFGSVAALIGWGVLIELLRAVNSLYVIAAHTRFQTRATLSPALVGTATIMVSIVPLTRWNLYAGSGIALALGMAGSTVYLALNLRRSFRTKIPYSQIARAVIFSVPIALSLIIAQLIAPHPSVPQAILVLLWACLITLCVEALISRQVLLARKL